MRTVAVLCDIHGSLPALDAVLAELRAEPPDAVVLGAWSRTTTPTRWRRCSRRAPAPLPPESLTGTGAAARG